MKKCMTNEAQQNQHKLKFSIENNSIFNDLKHQQEQYDELSKKHQETINEIEQIYKILSAATHVQINSIEAFRKAIFKLQQHSK
ncbi:hypothetical protein SS50377_27664 [Spironucleus salmonicida]|uniref:Uncharacterized protein n=1 Tax=Spironucleus salmonicida TaxID=348837 RepID=V6M0A0_9EUKA|nr:hypothetical protein SS50377_27664 [Spironucleus salmonicida]|eukprot:EST46559.1 Hypothetical protein SS50377_13363 [Spironucleus salmonicida]